MKLWLCVLSALLLAGCTAGTDVPGSVTPTAVPTPAATETGETAEVAATPAPTADAVPPQGLVETGAAVLEYDEIRFLRYSRELQSYPEVEYYTMCKDGKWGLMRSDGSEVLPCRAPEPLFECGLGNRHWHDYTNGLSWEAADALRKEYARQLQACGDGVICDGHDGDGYLEFVYLQEHTVSIYSGSLGPGEFSAPTEDDLLRYSGSANGPVPTCGGTIHRESDDWYYFVSDGQYAYRYKDGTAANDSIYTAADFFFDAPLAPAQRDGKWVYLDTAGREVTEPCYDSVYAPDYYTEEPLVYRRAAPLLNGYAPVSRDGKFGLLDSTGAEFVPCAYDGLAWDGGLGQAGRRLARIFYSRRDETRPAGRLAGKHCRTRHAAHTDGYCIFLGGYCRGASKRAYRAGAGIRHSRQAFRFRAGAPVRHPEHCPRLGACQIRT